MEVTLVQGILIAVVVFICALDGCLEAFMWFRPLVVSFLIGIVLGDVQTGLAAGAVAELSYLGLLTVGGTVPPDPLIAGLMTTVLAYTTGQSVEVTLGLSLPFALLGQWLGIICNTTFAGFLAPLDKACDEANSKKFMRIVFGSMAIKAFLYSVIAFVSAYALQSSVSTFVNAFPNALIHGFEIAGGLLPAVGLALLLVVMLNKRNIAYLFLGFVMVTVCQVNNILPVAIVAGAIAFIGYINNSEVKEWLKRNFSKASKATEGEGGDDDGI